MKLRKINTMFVVIIILMCLIFSVIGDKPCVPRKEDGYESLVCVCNSTYCDEISKIEKQPGNFVLYTSSKSGLRFHKQEGKITDYVPTPYEKYGLVTQALKYLNLIPKTTEDILFQINRENRRQSIEGFGAAFTDSAAINYMSLSKKTRKKVIKSYFSENGIEYNLGRVPVASTDFSTHPYTYQDFPENDVVLSNFSLTKEDFDYKIPFIKAAQAATTDDFHLISAAWTPPLWMKTAHQYGPPTELLPEYYQTWANYQLMFLKEYEKFGIKFWGLSAGNEPVNGFTGIKNFISVGWLPHKQAHWIAENLGPTIKSEENYPDIKIITGDENRRAQPLWLMLMSLNQKAMSYIDGMGLHWYENRILPSFLNDVTHDLFKDVFLLATEACRGLTWTGRVVLFGHWKRAELYIKDIIEQLNHWSIGWMDWNLMLNPYGGPNWFSNFVDAPIIAFEKKDEFIKQPMFYAMGHASKFIPRGSINIQLEQITGKDLEKTAFLRPDGGITILFRNGYDSSYNVTVKEKDHGEMTFIIPPFSINTLVYW